MNFFFFGKENNNNIAVDVDDDELSLSFPRLVRMEWIGRLGIFDGNQQTPPPPKKEHFKFIDFKEIKIFSSSVK